jgi:hypothetical protein
MRTFLAVLLVCATPVAFGHGQTRNKDEEPMTQAANRVNWTSAGALNALFKDKGTVKRFLNEVANAGDAIGIEAFAEVLDYRFVDLNRDGRLELVAVEGGRRPAESLEIVFQTAVPPVDRLVTTYDGFVMTGVAGFGVGDLNEVLRDLDRDGAYEIVIPQKFGEIVGTSFPQTTIQEVFSWKDGDYVNVSARYPEFYRDEVLPRLERQLRVLEALPATVGPSERADRRAEREMVARDIAEARRRASRN